MNEKHLEKRLMMAGYVKKLLLVLAVMLTPCLLCGQQFWGYDFEQGVDADKWVRFTGADGYASPQLTDIGFEFYFFGRVYHRSYVDHYGLLHFLQDGESPFWCQAFYDYPQFPMIAGFGSILSTCYVCDSSYVRRKVVGESGNRVLVYEICRDFSNDEGSAQLFQVQIAEADASITFVYHHGSSSGVVGMQSGDGKWLGAGYRAAGMFESVSERRFVNMPPRWTYFTFRPVADLRCGAPSGFYARQVTSHSVALSWERNSQVDSTELFYRPEGETGLWNTVSTTDTSLVVEGLLPTTAYEFRLMTHCSCGIVSDTIALEGKVLTLCTEDDRYHINPYNLYGPDVDCRSGSWGHVDNLRYVVWSETDPEQSRHSVVRPPVQMAVGTGNQLPMIPDGHCYSVRLGNWMRGVDEESITYTIHVDTNEFDLLILRYALVQENPNHTAEQQPRFEISITDEQGYLIDPCYSIRLSSGYGNVQWQHSGSTVWHNWTPLGLDLSPFHGRTIKLRLENRDCKLGGHYGYSLFTLEDGFRSLRAAQCGESSLYTFYAPQGFSYRWYRHDNPRVTLGTANSFSVSQSGYYSCWVSYTTGDNVCGFELTAWAGVRYPVASYTLEADECNRNITFRNTSFVSHDEQHTQVSTERCESYLWRFDDGTTSTALNPTHHFEAGEHVVELVAMLANGLCRDSVSYTFVTQELIDDTIVDALPCNGPYVLGGASFRDTGDYRVEVGCYQYLLRLGPPVHSIDTVYDSICIGKVYSFYQFEFDSAGVYSVEVDCVEHVLVLSQYADYLEHLDTIVCNGEGFNFYGTDYSQAGNYDYRVPMPSGCDSVFTLTLAVRQRPQPEFDFYQTCHEPGYHYLIDHFSGEGLPVGSFSNDSNLIYSWSVDPVSEPLPSLRGDTLTFAPHRAAAYRLICHYGDQPSCPTFDTIVLKPVEALTANLEVWPSYLTVDNLNMKVYNRSVNALGHRWYVDGELMEDTSQILYYPVRREADSVQVGIKAFNKSCRDSAEVTVPMVRYMLTFPNIFTPGMEVNSTFGPTGSNVSDFEMWIYDRKGQLIFHSTSFDQRWDGTCDGIPCRQESYVYTCLYRTPIDESVRQSGTVTLLR